MAGLCAPLSTLRRCPRGHLRMTRGRCGSLLLHRDGLAPSTPCRSPGALRSTPMNRHLQSRLACLKRADFVAKVFLRRRTKILRAADAFCARRCEGLYRLIQNRSWTSVVALKSDAAGERSKDHLSLDF